MSSIICKCEQLDLDHFTLHTGQHYSYEMDSMLFEELNIPLARYNLGIGSGTHGKQTGKMLESIEEVLVNNKPDIVLVQGDTNTTLAGALAASKLHIPIGHVEAGLRSFDRRMPEEINRVIVDHISDYLFAPTEIAKTNLINEGIPEKKIFTVGNTITDVVYRNLGATEGKLDTLRNLGLIEKGYFVATVHRAENVEDPVRLANILKGFRLVYREFGMTVVFPAHPRTVKMIERFGLEIPTGTLMIKPLGYLQFLQLLRSARLVLSDSGGVQEETCILGVGCVTMRDNTERPETVDIGANVLVGANAQQILDGTRNMMQVICGRMQPYGNGNTAETILELITQDFCYDPKDPKHI